MKVVRLLALNTGCLYSPANIPGTHFCYRMNLHQSHNTAGRTMSMKNSKYTIEDRIRDLPPCSAVQNQPPCNPISCTSTVKNVYVTRRCQWKWKISSVISIRMFFQPVLRLSGELKCSIAKDLIAVLMFPEFRCRCVMMFVKYDRIHWCILLPCNKWSDNWTTFFDSSCN